MVTGIDRLCTGALPKLKECVTVWAEHASTYHTAARHWGGGRGAPPPWLQSQMQESQGKGAEEGGGGSLLGRCAACVVTPTPVRRRHEAVPAQGHQAVGTGAGARAASIAVGSRGHVAVADGHNAYVRASCHSADNLFAQVAAVIPL